MGARGTAGTEGTVIPKRTNCVPSISRSLPPQHGGSSGYEWKRRPPDMKGSCEYTE
jgi:hypothetical protein